MFNFTEMASEELSKSTSYVTFNNQSQSSLQPVSLDNDVPPSNGSLSDSYHGNVDTYLWMYWSPFTFTVGIIGNLFIVLVFVRSPNRKQRKAATTPIYLTLMAIADIVFLVFGIVPEWLEACEFLIFNELHPVACKIEKFMFYTSGDVAIWIITMFTFDRFIAVCFPFKKNFICVPKYAKVIATSTFLLSVLKNIHVFWTRGAEYDSQGDLISNCGRPQQFADFENYIRPWIAFVLISLIPFVLIFMCNIFIVRAVIRARRNMAHACSADNSFMQTIFMCLSASIAFLICITPSMVLLIGKPYWTESEHSNYSYDIAKAVNNQLVYVNHSINFFLYCVTGRKFREEFIALFCCCCGTDQRDGRKSVTSGKQVSSAMAATYRKTIKFPSKTASYSPAYNNNNSVASSRYIERLQKQMKQDNGVLISGSTLSLDA